MFYKTLIKVSKLFEKKISIIYIFVITISILFLINHVLNHYLINLKIKKIEEFTDQITIKPKPTEKSVLVNKKNIPTNNNVKEERKPIEKQNLQKYVNYNKKSFRNMLSSHNDDNMNSNVIKPTNKNKELKHPNKSDYKIKYYQKKDNHIDKCDQYLKYYSNKFNEYDKKKKNESKYGFLSDSKVPFTSDINFNITNLSDLDRNNLKNVKEYNLSSFKNPNINYGKLPERKDRPSCFKCQRPQFICHDAFIPKDFSKNNRLQDYDTEPISAEKLIKLQKGSDIEEDTGNDNLDTQTVSVTNDTTIDKNINLEKKTEKEVKNIEKEVKKQELHEEKLLQKQYEDELKNTKLKGCSQCIKQDNKDYLKFKEKYKATYLKNRFQNPNEFNQIVNINNNQK